MGTISTGTATLTAQPARRFTADVEHDHICALQPDLALPGMLSSSAEEQAALQHRHAAAPPSRAWHLNRAPEHSSAHPLLSMAPALSAGPWKFEKTKLPDWWVTATAGSTITITTTPTMCHIDEKAFSMALMAVPKVLSTP